MTCENHTTRSWEVVLMGVGSGAMYFSGKALLMVTMSLVKLTSVGFRNEWACRSHCRDFGEEFFLQQRGFFRLLRVFRKFAAMIILGVEDNGHPESVAQRDNGAECSWVVTNNQGWLESFPMSQKF